MTMDDINILVFEDNILTADEIKSYLKNAGYQDVAVANSADQAIKLINENYPDLAILDVKTLEDEKAGIKIAELLNSRKKIPIVFLTAYHKELKDLILDTMPSAFLGKPYYEHNLIIAIEQAVVDFLKTKGNSKLDRMGGEPIFNDVDKEIWIKKGKIHKVAIADILYVESVQGCINIVTLIGVFPYSSTLRVFSKFVDDSNFIKVHKSFLVNFSHIKSFDHESVSINSLDGIKEISISRSGYEAILERIKIFRSK